MASSSSLKDWRQSFSKSSSSSRNGGKKKTTRTSGRKGRKS